MIHFNRLRLTGFKSFVDPTELVIAPGMTGIVGPNGCGKSNLVEALRWVMGETSAKQMRGGEMDDVIFGGTSNRPSRNLAEVALVLDNSQRAAPALFNDYDELEVIRRIERGDGSAYKVNGKEVRARDVQLLFADAATGARSTAMVSQGRVGAIINAKPSERRGLLEEAAGIGGLHSRRHEAETRLRAAETNLGRLEDVLTTLDSQLQGLRRQARQAQRYRHLSEQIRDVEAKLFLVRWLAALRAVEDARVQRKLAEEKVVELTQMAAGASIEQAEAAAGMPALRQAEAEAAARLQRLVIARDQLTAEEARIAQARRDMENRLQQIAADRGREQSRLADSQQALARLEAESAELIEAQGDEAEIQEEAALRLEALTEEVERLDEELTALNAGLAAAEAERSAANRRLIEAEMRRRKLEEQAVQARDARKTAARDGIDETEVVAAELRLEAAQEKAEEARAAVETADLKRQETQAAAQAARDALQREAAGRARLRAEVQALTAVLAGADKKGGAGVLDDITVEPGYEAALAAALGDDLSAPADIDAPQAWRSLPPLDPAPPLPAGAEPLARFVAAPPALARRLSQVGVVQAELGADLRSDLKVGQRLVSREGGLWRWDGFTVAAGTPSAAAARLEQKNRLAGLKLELEAAEERVAVLEEKSEAATAAADAAAQGDRQARERVRAAESELNLSRQSHQAVAAKAAAAAQRLAGLDATLARVEAELVEAQATEEEARAAKAGLADAGPGRERLSALRADLAERRAAQTAARSSLDRAQREAAERRRRLEAIAKEVTSWRQRIDGAAQHQEELAERHEEAMAELERLSSVPMEIAEKRAALLDQLEQAETARKDAADALAVAEQRLSAADRRAKEAEQALAQAREDRVRREAAVEACDAACRNVARAIAEKGDLTPEKLREQVGEVSELTPELEHKLERLSREREGMGPVNLRAEQEMTELEVQIGGLHSERDDLIGAIAKLRQGIAELNREGRERLLASFNAVDMHFRELFQRLFGGGKAHLALTESDDPLAAGLEIMASPPGKRLQVLSLLSGGEQALTAIALLFAVFMTNPAPICVLDEVDAPLDDANVDRFCSLVADMARSSGTRFLVVTHHRMTMARMDRLFGVTMMERGVSQLVSVDLAAAVELRELA